VYSEKTPDDEQRNLPKHVEFYFKNKFQELAHLIGFIIRIPTSSNHLKQEILTKSVLTREGAPSKIDRSYLPNAWNCSLTNLITFNLLTAELNSTCHLQALLGAHHILHFSRIRVNIVGLIDPTFLRNLLSIIGFVCRNRR
jgi:nucleoside recognition membrane protein YjiH